MCLQRTLQQKQLSRADVFNAIARHKANGVPHDIAPPQYSTSCQLLLQQLQLLWKSQLNSKQQPSDKLRLSCLLMH
jgi:hypothetical protein